MAEQYFAAIDLGTNSCRLVVSDEQGNYVYNQSASTRLGEGMSSHNCFTPEAIARGIGVLKEFGDIIRASNCRYRAIATAACRMATNGEEFVARVKDECGINLEVINGQEEARLNLVGALSHAASDKPYILIFDIGGGSTEVTLAKVAPMQIIHTVSIPWGARNASEYFGINDYESQVAQGFINEILVYMNNFKQDSHYEQYKGQISFVATSSTPLRLAAYIGKKQEYNREAEDGCVMNIAQIDAAIAEIKTTTETERASSIYIGPKRAPIFMAGCLLLQTICKELEIDNLTASYKSAKDSIIKELIEEAKHGTLD